MRIGVLAVQGAFAEHISKLNQLDIESFEIRQSDDITGKFNGLILPGGESTVMKKLLHELDLFEPLKNMIENGIPVLATCAGMILLAEKIDSGENSCFGTMNMTVKRNAYGRQLGSFRCIDNFNGIPVEMPFIRAPYVTETGDGVEILAEHNGKIVAVRQGKQIAVAFHPELTDDTTVYNLFIRNI
ncbi:MAG: pyridoxal 5'-phosphate synthase glutaminase subunit PdxT [Ruminococcus sp.]|nr:pyridoxal 5'-phosphate synthase glutaminase subunit PdxT [Ruminococcus sp.]